MTKPIQLHVGYVGVTRKGKRVEITEFREKNGHYQWLAGDDESYRKDGSYLLTVTSDLDIVGPWVEPVDYNDGFWHQWNGGECPVHPKSTVEMISAQSGKPTRSAAISFTWDHELDAILAFRVTEEFIKPKEPRELWVSLNDYQAHETEADAQAHDKVLGCNHGYFRVKEII
jgi:hypothetical protein